MHDISHLGACPLCRQMQAQTMGIGEDFCHSGHGSYVGVVCPWCEQQELLQEAVWAPYLSRLERDDQRTGALADVRRAWSKTPPLLRAGIKDYARHGAGELWGMFLQAVMT